MEGNLLLAKTNNFHRVTLCIVDSHSLHPHTHPYHHQVPPPKIMEAKGLSTASAWPFVSAIGSRPCGEIVAKISALPSDRSTYRMSPTADVALQLRRSQPRDSPPLHGLPLAVGKFTRGN